MTDQKTNIEQFDIDRMLDFAALPEDEINPAIAKDPSWNALYHFSHLRTNIFSAISFTGEEKILEIGAKCGALTGFLCDKGSHVDAVEDEPDFVRVLSMRYMDRENLTIHQGTIQQSWTALDDKYDVIVAAGADASLIPMLAEKIGIGGRILFATPNRFGLKYFAGCRDDISGELFDGITRCADDETIAPGQGELEAIIEQAGLSVAYRYYPYPDWVFPSCIYSDERLPKQGELWENERNFDRPRASLFDEQKAFDRIIENGLFPIFSNSFLYEISYAKDKVFRDEAGRLIPSSKIYKTKTPDERILYSKASDDRASSFRIHTDLVRLAEGKREENLTYRKRPDPLAKGHITEMASAYEQTERTTFGSSICFNRCSLRKDGLYLEPVKGESLDSIAWRAFGDDEKLSEIFSQVKTHLGNIHKHLGFIVTDGFSRVFGDIPTYGGGEEPVELGTSAKYLDCDILLSNIMVDDGIWNIIDYEWCFGFPVPINFAVYRCIKNFYIVHGIYDEKIYNAMMEKVGIPKDQIPIYDYMDDHMIREYVLKDYTNLSDLGQRLLKVSVGLAEIVEAQGKLARKDEIIEELTDTLAKTQKAVADLQNCASMKITAPLRAIASVFKKQDYTDE